MLTIIENADTNRWHIFDPKTFVLNVANREQLQEIQNFQEEQKNARQDLPF